MNATFDHVDLCQDAFHLFNDTCEYKTNMSDKAPVGHLLCTTANAQNDHAPVELKRVDCLEGGIRRLLNDATFTLNRATCTHHKLGLIATDKKCRKPVNKFWRRMLVPREINSSRNSRLIIWWICFKANWPYCLGIT